MAGLSCAQSLRSAGVRVSLFDKGRGPGGRMSSRRIETPLGSAVFDFGAQYFTTRDIAFAEQVRSWEKNGLVARWPEARHDAYIGTPSMNTVLRHLAENQTVSFTALVKGLKRQGRQWQLICEGHEGTLFDGVVLALPAEQTAPILTLHDFELAQAALFARSQPCWTGMFAFAAPLEYENGIMRDRGIIAWAARDNAKPGRTGPERWVVQAGPQWSTSHLEHSQESVGPLLLEALLTEIGTPLVNRSGNQFTAGATDFRQGPDLPAFGIPPCKLVLVATGCSDQVLNVLGFREDGWRNAWSRRPR